MPSLATWKEDASGSSISLRSMAESRGSGRGVSPFHLSPGCIRGAGFVVWFGGWVCSCWFLFTWIAPGFFARRLP